MNISLLPSNSTDFERSLEAAIDVVDIIGPAVTDLRGFKTHRPLNATIAPWLVYEYGLGPISAYFDTIEDLIDNGKAWQRIRGTPQAVIDALGWIGYDNIHILDQVTGRRRWHLYQIDMGELPLPGEVQRLADAEYLADLSDRARSFFWRGFYGYDVRSLVWGRNRWGRSIWGDSSGVKLAPGKTKWSHGRQHDVTVTATVDEEVDLDVVFTVGQELSWPGNMTWKTPGISWKGVLDAVALKVWLMQQKKAHIGFYDAGGAAIGYIPVFVDVLNVTDTGSSTAKLKYRIVTQFGDGFGDVAHTLSLIFGAENADGVKPGVRWLEPDDIVLTGDTKVGSVVIDTTFQQTIKEFFNVTMALPPA